MIQKKQTAFTLIELSIVLIIIGLVVTGVVAGKNLVDVAKLAGARSATTSSPIISIENLVLWLDATSRDAFSTQDPENGDLIALWNDTNPKAISKNNATQTGADSLKPTYAKSGINGLPALSFVNDYLTGTVLALPAYTKIIVSQRNTNAQNNTLSHVTGGFEALYGNALDTVRIFHGGAHISTTSLNVNQPYIITATSDSSGNVALFIDGNSEGTASLTMPSGVLPYEVGSHSGVNRFDGFIGEIILYNRVLSPEERTSIESYLSNKWGIDLS